MDIIFTKDLNPLGIVHIDLTDKFKVNFGDAVVKEINISNSIDDNEDRYLRSVYEQISQIDYYKADHTIIYFSNNLYYDIVAPIKTILNRTIHYVNHGLLENLEMLSIRFVDDENPIIDGKVVRCDDTCQYLNKEQSTCKKYCEKLIINQNVPLVCERCFLNSKEALLNEKAKEAFKSMEERFKVFGE